MGATSIFHRALLFVGSVRFKVLKEGLPVEEVLLRAAFGEVFILKRHLSSLSVGRWVLTVMKWLLLLLLIGNESVELSGVVVRRRSYVLCGVRPLTEHWLTDTWSGALSVVLRHLNDLWLTSICIIHDLRLLVFEVIVSLLLLSNGELDVLLPDQVLQLLQLIKHLVLFLFALLVLATHSINSIVELLLHLSKFFLLNNRSLSDHVFIEHLVLN